MADNATTETAPGTHPDAAVINDDGSVTTRTGEGWVWCTDTSTGARVDIPARLLPKKGVTPVPGYPVNYTPIGRTPKPAVLLAGLTEGPDFEAAQATVASLRTSVGSAPTAPELDDLSAVAGPEAGTEVSTDVVAGTEPGTDETTSATKTTRKASAR
jgi:hypothetical protein